MYLECQGIIMIDKFFIIIMFIGTVQRDRGVLHAGPKLDFSVMATEYQVTFSSSLSVGIFRVSPLSILLSEVAKCVSETVHLLYTYSGEGLCIQGVFKET